MHEMPKSGTFCWNELATRDLGAAKKFYAELLGWQLQESTAAGMAYNEIVVDGEHIGGMYNMTAEQGDAPSHWMAYVAVDDVDAKARQAFELGGKVCVPPTDIPNVGRFCVITDPTGATISLVKLSGARSE
ncbi:MAG: VOC family protein [Pyrinomonadaceae bacterium]|nr:VOC family protein [Pyrinomonadaceae bacterium]